MDNVSTEVKNFGVQPNGGQQSATVIEKFNVELLGANAGQMGDGDKISVGNREEVQVVDLTTGNSQQEIAVGDVVGPVKSKVPADILATTVFVRMFEATADTLKASAVGQDRQSDMAASVGKINMQGEVLNRANIGNNQQKVAGEGHIGNAVKVPSNEESNLNVVAEIYKPSKEHAASLIALPEHVEGAEISPTSVVVQTASFDVAGDIELNVEGFGQTPIDQRKANEQQVIKVTSQRSNANRKE
ncbi:hypothetical protein A4A49_27552 [Nicotiana attenuata]|uniref:Uncharacterized protein n=1 Tax=Nicotiana attenuata TaxID=49451 RepID=A0A1J6K682_NICAT|nr:hypothetical protein A4A49_27552 [Nicotiana attenuata]